MVLVYLGDQQRHISAHSMWRRIADHGITSAGKFFLRFFGYVARQTRKDKITIKRRRWALHDDLFHTFRHIAGQAPGTSLGERFPLRTIRGGERGYFELRVIFEQLNEALAYHASRPENAHMKFFHCDHLTTGDTEKI